MSALLAVLNLWAHATVTASSEKQPAKGTYAPFRAIDHDTHTGWCSGAKDSSLGQTLTIVFDEPVTFRSLDLETRHGNAPTAFDVRLDGGAPKRVKITGSLGVMKGTTARSIEIKVAAQRRGEVCLDADVDGPHIYTGDVARLAPLEAAVTALFAARKTCDEAGFAAVATLPVGKARRFTTAATLAAACKKRQLSQLQPEGWPRGSCGMLDEDRVACTGTGPDAQWVLAWDGAAWKLVSVTEMSYPE